MGKTEPIGTFLLKIQAINEKELQEILEIQKNNPDKKFGEIAMEHGYVNEASINKYLWGVE